MTMLMLSPPVGGNGRVWTAMQLRAPGSAADLAGVDDMEAICRFSNLPRFAAFDLSPADLAAAMAWLRAAAP